MSDRTKVLDKRVKDKINDCVENLREMQEIEIELQDSCGVKPHITTLCACDIDLWLQGWKKTRGRDLQYYTCLLGVLGEACRKMRVETRIKLMPRLNLIYKNKGLKPPPPVVDPNPSQLQALHEEHLQNELDQLEKYLCQIQAKHHFLADQLRSKAV